MSSELLLCKTLSLWKGFTISFGLSRKDKKRPTYELPVSVMLFLQLLIPGRSQKLVKNCGIPFTLSIARILIYNFLKSGKKARQIFLQSNLIVMITFQHPWGKQFTRFANLYIQKELNELLTLKFN